MNRYQNRLTPKAGELGLAPTNNNLSRSRTEEKEKSHHHIQQGSGLRKPQKERQPELPLPCSCNRAKQLVLCQRCGGTFQGRVKKVCAKHPSAIFLLDMSSCPRSECKAGLEALKEFPIAQHQHQQRPRQRVNSVKKRKCDTPESSEMEMGDTD